MFLSDRHGFQNLSIDLFCLNIDDVHLLSDTLQSGLCAQSSHVGTDETVGIFGDGLEIYIF